MKRLSLGKEGLSALQWFIFIAASSIALPIVIGGVFGLAQEEITSLMQRTFFVVGVSSMLQAIAGHRFPVIDGPAGSWVSVFIMMAGMAERQGMSGEDALRLLEGGMLIAGALLLLLGVTQLFYRLLNWFTPLVTHTFLFILSLQLSGVLLKGMLGVNGEGGSIRLEETLVAVAVFAGVVFLTVRGRGWTRNYAILIGIACGWGAHAWIGGEPKAAVPSSEWIRLPELWAWGSPSLNAGMAATAVLFTLILISNLFAAIAAAEQEVPRRQSVGPSDYNRGSVVGGISHGLASAFSSVGVVPLPITAGFIRMTGQTGRKSFLVACAALAGISLVPGIVHHLAHLPTSVASAVSLAAFVQMTANSLQSLSRAATGERELKIAGIGLLIGIGFTIASASAPAALPAAVQYVLGNGLLAATLIVMSLERVWRPSFHSG
ncbi:xanthine permease [Cohnella sp. CIP 111063]|uniref:purine/pyrimidine permease n=1 Tax=unclassified Cohnella TaxID=2636738 RepID=UPI000B8BD690|nr:MULTISPECIES: purine/pyrimidine permease [unclassified Cohnella]OXS59809.1 xanthine permease [Cohnella sp. CIP 111063]PRX72601.1 xanthine/uracil permease [Cohnella sp. SGD-V74]